MQNIRRFVVVDNVTMLSIRAQRLGRAAKGVCRGRGMGGIGSPTKGVWPEDTNHESRDVGGDEVN